MDERWAIWIDIEGFRKKYPENFQEALYPLGELMRGIYDCGESICRESPDRLFAHQTGDGFIIVSEFMRGHPELPVGIAIYLMRKVLLAGGVAKAAISNGEFADVQACYPEDLMRLKGNGILPIGDGLLSIFPVMGTALINAYSLSVKEHGAILLVDNEIQGDATPEYSIVKREDASEFKYSVVDWVGSDTAMIRKITSATNTVFPTASVIAKLLDKYICDNPNSPPHWLEKTRSLSGMEVWKA
jgi:hypothetical protein